MSDRGIVILLSMLILFGVVLGGIVSTMLDPGEPVTPARVEGVPVGTKDAVTLYLPPEADPQTADTTPIFQHLVGVIGVNLTYWVEGEGRFVSQFYPCSALPRDACGIIQRGGRVEWVAQ